MFRVPPRPDHELSRVFNRTVVMRLSVTVLLGLGILTVVSTGSHAAPPAPNDPVSTANAPLGKAVYDQKCAPCHGLNGKGDGAVAKDLSPQPRNFTDGKFKFRTTASGSLPTDADLERIISEGLHGTAMPDWKPFLYGDTLNAVIAHIKTFSPRFAAEQPKPIKLGAEPATNAASIAAGKIVYAKLQCEACHGTKGDLTDAGTTDLADDWGNPDPAANLTEPWTFRGGSTAKDIYTRCLTGLDGAPMPSYTGSASEKEMWDLAHYVVSIARKPAWEMNADELKAFYSSQDQQRKTNPVTRGKYIVETHGCADCHSPVRPDGSTVTELYMAGGMKYDLYPFGTYVTHNLTSDKETGLGNFTDDQIREAITHGQAGDGWRMLPFPMPWTAYAHMNTDDVNGVIAYLRTLPPVHNKTPKPEHPNFFSYMAGKFQMLIMHKDLEGKAYPGNAGDAPVNPNGKDGAK